MNQELSHDLLIKNVEKTILEFTEKCRKLGGGMDILPSGDVFAELENTLKRKRDKIAPGFTDSLIVSALNLLELFGVHVYFSQRTCLSYSEGLWLITLGRLAKYASSEIQERLLEVNVRFGRISSAIWLLGLIGRKPTEDEMKRLKVRTPERDYELHCIRLEKMAL